MKESKIQAAVEEVKSKIVELLAEMKAKRISPDISTFTLLLKEAGNRKDLIGNSVLCLTY